jgi:hypothetical protein
MEKILATHEVEDVDHWFSSQKRQEFFGEYGITATAFRPQDGSNMVAVLIETPDRETFDRAMQADEAPAAMKHDGVNPETLKVFEPR